MPVLYNDTIHIAVGINDRFAIPAQVMLHSLCRQTQRPVKLFLLYRSLSGQNRRMIRDTMASFGHETEELYIEDKWFRGATLCHNPLYSEEIYYRILLPYLTDVDKVLWIDADIVLTGGVEELYDVDLSQAYAAACMDIGEENGRRDEIKRKLGISEQVYFNSGVLLMNNQMIREIPMERFFSAIRRFDNVLVCPDQDLLNYMLGSRCLILPERFNYQHHMDADCSAEKGLLIHYIWKKPWNTDYCGHLDELFWHEALLCGHQKEYRAYRRGRRLAFVINEFIPAVRRKIGKMKVLS